MVAPFRLLDRDEGGSRSADGDQHRCAGDHHHIADVGVVFEQALHVVSELVALRHNEKTHGHEVETLRHVVVAVLLRVLLLLDLRLARGIVAGAAKHVGVVAAAPKEASGGRVEEIGVSWRGGNKRRGGEGMATHVGCMDWRR
jgi:hypothetical protein